MPTITLSTTTLRRNGTTTTVQLVRHADDAHTVRVSIGGNAHESPFPDLPGVGIQYPPAHSITAGVFYDAAVGALYRMGWR